MGYLTLLQRQILVTNVVLVTLSTMSDIIALLQCQILVAVVSTTIQLIHRDFSTLGT